MKLHWCGDEELPAGCTHTHTLQALTNFPTTTDAGCLFWHVLTHEKLQASAGAKLGWTWTWTILSSPDESWLSWFCSVPSSGDSSMPRIAKLGRCITCGFRHMPGLAGHSPGPGTTPSTLLFPAPLTAWKGGQRRRKTWSRKLQDPVEKAIQKPFQTYDNQCCMIIHKQYINIIKNTWKHVWKSWTRHKSWEGLALPVSEAATWPLQKLCRCELFTSHFRYFASSWFTASALECNWNTFRRCPSTSNHQSWLESRTSDARKVLVQEKCTKRNNKTKQLRSSMFHPCMHIQYTKTMLAWTCTTGFLLNTRSEVRILLVQALQYKWPLTTRSRAKQYALECHDMPQLAL